MIVRATSSAVADALERPERESDPGRPPLRSIAHDVERVLGQIHPIWLAQLVQLASIECEVFRSDLDEIPCQAPSGERKVELGPCHERHVRSGADAVEEKIEHLEADRLCQLVRVVEDQLDRLTDGRARA